MTTIDTALSQARKALSIREKELTTELDQIRKTLWNLNKRGRRTAVVHRTAPSRKMSKAGRAAIAAAARKRWAAWRKANGKGPNKKVEAK